MTAVEWADPPRLSKGEPVDVTSTVERLRQRPGSWARVFESSSGSVIARRKRKLEEAGCETDAVGGSGGVRHLYARWPA